VRLRSANGTYAGWIRSGCGPSRFEEGDVRVGCVFGPQVGGNAQRGIVPASPSLAPHPTRAFPALAPNRGRDTQSRPNLDLAPLANPALPNCLGLRLSSSPVPGCQDRYRHAPSMTITGSASCLASRPSPVPLPDRGEPAPVSQPMPDGTFQGLTGNPAVRKMHPGGAPRPGRAEG